MQKVLILSYFYPPCNLTPSQRVYSWAKYLNEFGYYPIIITRRWDYKINTPNDMSLETPDEIIQEKNSEYEVYYLPYKPNLKDRIYTKYGENKYKYLRKFLSFAELLLQNICINNITFKNIYFFASDYLLKNKDIKKAIVTANPYILFKFAYKLKKKTGIKWVADYRDAWTNCRIKYINRHPLFNLINSYDRVFEKRWVNTASIITSVSETLASQISSLVKVPGESLFNGFAEDDFNKFRNEKAYEKFTITYIGSLFAGQKITIFLEAYKRFIDSNVNSDAILLFPGLAFNKSLQKIVDDLMKGYKQFYKSTERIDRDEALKIEVKSHLLLYVAWQGFNGIVPSKIYEYIASGSYILVTPSDKDAVEEIIKSSGCGISCDTVEETVKALNDVYQQYLKGVKIKNDLNNPDIKQFSRKLQVQKLSKILNEI